MDNYLDDGRETNDSSGTDQHGFAAFPSLAGLESKQDERANRYVNRESDRYPNLYAHRYIYWDCFSGEWKEVEDGKRAEPVAFYDYSKRNPATFKELRELLDQFRQDD